MLGDYRVSAERVASRVALGCTQLMNCVYFKKLSVKCLYIKNTFIKNDNGKFIEFLLKCFNICITLYGIYFNMDYVVISLA